MKKHFLALGLATALLAPQAAGAEGFAINEWSAEGVAMGGARMFAEDDAANVAYNPASITKVKGEAMKSSFTYLSPHGKYEADVVAGGGTEYGQNKVHAGWAVGSYYVKQMNDKDWFGIAAFPRFSMVSEFERGSNAASSNAFFSKLVGVSVTPTYAHKFDKKWSAAVGAEINYVGLELQKNINLPYVALGVGKPGVTTVGTTQIEGESYALGWNAAANYAFDDKNEVGVVYRSKITHSLEADLKGYGKLSATGGDVFGNAYGCVTLPDSWALGYNHKFDKKTRVELNATRTNWSTYDALNISFDQPVLGKFGADSNKNWKDGWRYAIGVEHKLSDKYTVMAGYAYDESSIPYDGGDFMVPTGNRRTYSIGGRYNDKKQTVAVALGWMDIGGLNFKGHTLATGGTDAYSEARTRDNYCKVVSVSYQRNF